MYEYNNADARFEEVQNSLLRAKAFYPSTHDWPELLLQRQEKMAMDREIERGNH